MDNADDGAGLQQRLDRAMRALLDARDEKSDRGCVSLLSGGGSCFGLLVGLGMSVCSETTRPAGYALTALSCAGFILSLRAYGARLASQEQAERLIVEVAGGLGDNDLLRLYDLPASALHRLLYEARPELAEAILKILGAGGGAESMKHVRYITEEPQLFVSGHRPEVRRAASLTATRIAQRLEVARQSGTLLRPSDATSQSQLLRPAASADQTEPELLLRQVPEQGESDPGS
jgi:hypothetical protein